MLFAAAVALAATASVASAQDPCTVMGVEGTCQSDSCGFTFYRGLCAGASDVRCCANTWGSCSSGGKEGVCRTEVGCGGQVVSGLCPGPGSIRCCIEDDAPDAPAPDNKIPTLINDVPHFDRGNVQFWPLEQAVGSRSPVCFEDQSAGTVQVPASPVASNYGCSSRRFMAYRSNNRWHSGIDLYAPVGTPLRAMAAGRVTNRYYFYDSTCAIVFELDGGAGTLLYGEVDCNYEVDIGDTLEAGETIGRVGQLVSLGLSMLHFESYIAETGQNYQSYVGSIDYRLRNPTLMLLDLLDVADGQGGAPEPPPPPPPPPVDDVPADEQGCLDAYGPNAYCAESCVATGSSGDPLNTGGDAEHCPGSQQCCTGFLMSNAITFFDEDGGATWQRRALESFQSTIRWYAFYSEFACMYRNLPVETGTCGAEINLVDVAEYYSGAEHQLNALEFLQATSAESDLVLPAWLEFVRDYRNIGASGGSGGSGSGGSAYIPPALDTSESVGTCVTTYDGYQGHCIPTSACTGGTFNGLCPGSSSIRCCVAEETPAAPRTEYLSLSVFRELFENLSDTRSASMQKYFNEAMDDILSDSPDAYTTCHRLAAFSAQVGHESLGLLYFEELASGEAYNGRTDLGNVQPGDGPRFKGRGPIQLTGRANYRSFSAGTGFDAEVRPEQVNLPSRGFRAATWFWQANNLNRYATGSFNDFTTLSRRINGGYNGIDDRRARWAHAKDLLECDAPTSRSAALSDVGLALNDKGQLIVDPDLVEASNKTESQLARELGLSKSSADEGVSTDVFAGVVATMAVVVVGVIIGAVVMVRRRSQGGSMASQMT